jgi:hypothetical protein
MKNIYLFLFIYISLLQSEEYQLNKYNQLLIEIPSIKYNSDNYNKDYNIDFEKNTEIKDNILLLNEENCLYKINVNHLYKINKNTLITTKVGIGLNVDRENLLNNINILNNNIINNNNLDYKCFINYKF